MYNSRDEQRRTGCTDDVSMYVHTNTHTHMYIHECSPAAEPCLSPLASFLKAYDTLIGRLHRCCPFIASIAASAASKLANLTKANPFELPESGSRMIYTWAMEKVSICDSQSDTHFKHHCVSLAWPSPFHSSRYHCVIPKEYYTIADAVDRGKPYESTTVPIPVSRNEIPSVSPG